MRFNAPTNIVTVEPALEPVTPEDVKANAYVVDDSSDDTFIRTQLIPSARKMVETLANRSLITQTRQQIYDYLPECFWLRYGPVQTVSSVTYTDYNQAVQTLSATLYDVDSNRIPGRIHQGYGKVWPASLSKTNAVKVTYVAGYGATGSSVPIIYRRAIILLATHWYNNRDQFGCETDDMACAVASMLALEGRTLEYA